MSNAGLKTNKQAVSESANVKSVCADYFMENIFTAMKLYKIKKVSLF